MDRIDNIKKVVPYYAVAAVLMFAWIMLIVSGAATPFVSCFAVDASDRIYVGTDGCIRVYEEGEMVNSFSAQTSKEYMFTINEHQEIMLASSTTIYHMDLDGTVLQTKEEPGSDLFYQSQCIRKTFTSANGDEYQLRGQLGWTRIVKNQTETVYQISGLSYGVKWMIGLSFILMLTATVFLFRQEGNKKAAGL